MDDWTEDKCIKLVRAYRVRPMLWDPKHPYFFKKAMKPDFWEEIGTELNMSSDACKNKMVILLSSFRREKAKIMHSINEAKDSSTIYRSTWFAFKEMAFLLDKESERKRQINGIEMYEKEQEAINIKKPLIKRHSQESNQEKKNPQTIVLKRIKTENTEEVQINDAAKLLRTSSGSSSLRLHNQDNEEEIKSFTNFIGSKMKRYTEVTKNAVQQAICEIIFKADQNLYDRAAVYDNGNYEIENDEVLEIQDDDPLDKALKFSLENGQTIKLQYDSEDSI